jgi:DNA-binding NarL/FixJ family response regulator
MQVRPRVVIGHDHRLFVAGLERLLAPEFDIAAAIDALLSLPEAVVRLRPELVFQGLSNTPQLGFDVITAIHESRPHTRIVVVTKWAEATFAAEAFRRGAFAYIPLASPEAELLAGARAAMSGTPYLSPCLTGATMASLASSGLVEPPELTLTTHQRNVVRLLAQGKSMKEVAVDLNVTARTVAFHKYKVMRKFDVKSSAELVRFALKRGLV